MEINKRILIRVLEEAKIGSPSSSGTYSRSYFLFKIPMVVQESHKRETGENIALGEAELHAYLCMEAGYVNIPPEGADDNDDLLAAEKMLRLTLQGYEKLESLKKEVRK